MTHAEIHAFFVALVRPTADVIAAVPDPPPYRRGRSAGFEGPPHERAVAVGRGVCSKCREVGLVRQKYNRLWCRRCP